MAVSCTQTKTRLTIIFKAALKCLISSMVVEEYSRIRDLQSEHNICNGETLPSSTQPFPDHRHSHEFYTFFNSDPQDLY